VFLRRKATNTLSKSASDEEERKQKDEDDFFSNKFENLKNGSNEFKHMFKSLPENVRNAILVAQQRKKHSDFYYKLSQVNDKIQVFTNIFYNR
jgi:hypothetical protein